MTKALLLGVCLMALAMGAQLPCHASAGEADYLIGPEDVLDVTVWDHPDLSGKVQVSLDGTIGFQFIGKLNAAGVSPQDLALRIKALLANGYIRDPQVTIRVLEYKSQKVNLIGEVVRSGTYYLSRKMTVVEAVSLAGGPTREADNEVLILRGGIANAAGTERIMIDFKRALDGDRSQDVPLQSGDTVYIAKVRMFYIMGEVKNPGQYPLPKDTTVRKAISIAGGVNERAAIGRTKVVRVLDGKETEVRIELHEIVQPDDTIIVPQSYF